MLKLHKNNYTFWPSQVLPIVHAHEMEGYLFGISIYPSQYVDHNIREDIPCEYQVNPSFVI